MSNKGKNSKHNLARCCVVLPTYNERENVKLLLPEIIKVSEKEKNHGWEIFTLVIDDNSPDGTAAVVKNLAEKYDGKIFLLERDRKGGIGDACKAGFKHAIVQLKADVLIEMDADLSHNPNDIPRLLAKLNDGYDLVIGSRYVKGGKIEGWPWRRKFMSWAGNFLGRFALSFKVRDCTNGLRAIKASFASRILDRLDTRGNVFLLDMLYLALMEGARIAEIPTIFKKRQTGVSKLSNNDLMEFIKVALKLIVEM